MANPLLLEIATDEVAGLRELLGKVKKEELARRSARIVNLEAENERLWREIETLRTRCERLQDELEEDR